MKKEVKYMKQIPNNRILVSGSKAKVYDTLSNYGIENMDDAEQVLTYLKCHTDFLDENEKIDFSIVYPECKEGIMNFMVPQTNIYINLKLSTIFVVALLLDITLTRGFAQLFVNTIGLNGRVIVKLNEREGHKCIVKESACSKEKYVNDKLLEKYNGKCCNKNYKCRFRIDEECTCTDKQITRILNVLSDKNIFKKIGDLYEYQL